MREKRQPPERGEIARDGSLKLIKGTYKARGGGRGLREKRYFWTYLVLHGSIL